MGAWHLRQNDKSPGDFVVRQRVPAQAVERARIRQRVARNRLQTRDDVASDKLAYLGKPELKLIREAYKFADEAHLGQFRASGEPYITHPIAVAGLVADWRLDAQAVLVTRGPGGMSLFERGGRHTHLPTVAREVYDVTGAGDTVVSVVALALAAGADLVSACVLANHAAGIVIREVGTAACSTAELKASLAGART